MKDFTYIVLPDGVGPADEAAVRDAFRRVTLALIARRLTVTTMESCTAGQIASLITDTEGASAVLQGAFVTYANAAKVRQGVPAALIERYGVYSPQTAAAMARACRDAYDADIGIGVTGTMGNADPANGDSVPGEAFFAIARREDVCCWRARLRPMQSRLAYKLALAGQVAEQLLALLGEPRDSIRY